MTDSSTGEGAAYGSRDPDALARRAGARANPDPDQHLLVADRV
ncbi:MAG: 16S ribosomal RNA methyltransferase A, partial [Methanobacteriota archaeon]